MVRGNLSGLNLSATSPLLSVGVLVLIYELVVWTHWWDIFTPLLLHRLGEQRGRGASRHAFTVANRFSAQWQNLALGLRFHCVSVGGERLSMSQRERGTSACQVFGLPSVGFGLSYVIPLFWEVILPPHKTLRNVQLCEGKKKKKKTSSSTLSAANSPLRP